MTSATGENGWMLELIEGVQGVRHALVFTNDGFVTVASNGTERDDADRLAAACSAMASLGKSVAAKYGNGGIASHVMYEFNGGFLFLRGAGDGTYLAVVTEAVIDPALVGQQMAATVQRIGERTLSAAERPRQP